MNLNVPGLQYEVEEGDNKGSNTLDLMQGAQNSAGMKNVITVLKPQAFKSQHRGFRAQRNSDENVVMGKVVFHIGSAKLLKLISEQEDFVSQIE